MACYLHKFYSFCRWLSTKNFSIASNLLSLFCPHSFSLFSSFLNVLVCSILLVLSRFIIYFLLDSRVPKGSIELVFVLPHVRPSVCLSVCPSVRLSVRLSVCLSVRVLTLLPENGSSEFSDFWTPGYRKGSIEIGFVIRTSVRPSVRLLTLFPENRSSDFSDLFAWSYWTIRAEKWQSRDFFRKFLLPWKWDRKVKIGPKIEFFGNISRTLH